MKKNILAAIAATIVSASVLSGACFTANASTADGTTDPNFVPRYEEEVELELAPPICILPEEEIPTQAWDAIFEVMDQNDDGEVRVADAIAAKKAGYDALAKTICNFIVDDGYTEPITMSPVPLQEIANYIRKDQFELVSIWKDDIEDGEPYMARFMFLNKNGGSFFVYETQFITDDQGFINLWDVNGDKAVTEKDAAKVYLDTEDEKKALTISAYAKDGNGAFACYGDATSRMALELERMLMAGDELVGVDGGDITVFSYDSGIMNMIW